jgi:transposase-like protein
MPDLPSRPTHPNCPSCDVSMWLVKIELGEIADHQQFECKVCDGTMRRTIPREQRV